MQPLQQTKTESSPTVTFNGFPIEPSGSIVTGQSTCSFASRWSSAESFAISANSSAVNREVLKFTSDVFSVSELESVAEAFSLDPMIAFPDDSPLELLDVTFGEPLDGPPLAPK